MALILWRLNPDCRLHWRQWQEEYLLFDATSGQTHFLNAIGAEILQLLSTDPRSANQLIACLYERFDLPSDLRLRRYVEQSLASFDELGLIQSARH